MPWSHHLEILNNSSTRVLHLRFALKTTNHAAWSWTPLSTSVLFKLRWVHDPAGVLLGIHASGFQKILKSIGQKICNKHLTWFLMQVVHTHFEKNSLVGFPIIYLLYCPKKKKSVRDTKWAGQQRQRCFWLSSFPRGLSASLHTCAWEAQRWSCDFYMSTSGKDAQPRRAVSRGAAWGERAWQQSSGFLWSQTTLKFSGSNCPSHWKPHLCAS